jgi:hypothetical protein
MKSASSVVAGYPPTWVAVAAVAAAEWFLISWFSPPAVISIVLVVLGIVFLAGWVLTMRATGTLHQLRLMKSLVGEEDPEAIEALEDELRDLGSEQSVDQLRLLGRKRDNLTEVLKRRMDAGELTYGRYLGSAQKVYEAAIRNLGEVAVSLRSVSTIDIDYIDRRLAQLREDLDSGEPGLRETDTLQERMTLHRTQHDRVAALLAQNEAAMTVIDRTAAALADVPLGRQQSAEAEEAMERLEELAERTGRYFGG